MTDSTLEVDYLIVGAGAAGMAFADSLLSASRATMAIVDRHHRPGGHWNDAYPFVRLHQPAAMYGVNSTPLGSGKKDEVGPNKGFYELASGQEVLSHFDNVMRQRFLPSGRVHHFPMSEAGEDGVVTSRLSGKQTAVRARKVVDATHSATAVPSTTRPRYEVAPGVACVPLNDLPRRAGEHSEYVVVGAGKTAMDAILWLLENGADPDSIRWIMPRDAWLLNRVNFQPGEEFFARGMQSLADQVEAVAEADSIDDVFLRLEAAGELFRIDPAVKPEIYHCATVSEGELEQLRRIRNIVRLGRVTRVEAEQIVLEKGTIPTSRESLHIDCSAAGIPQKPSRPIFEGDRITPQWVRWCQPTFSAALIGHVEATFEDEAEKNRTCRPIVPPNVPADWLRMMAVELANRQRWAQDPEVGKWLVQSRLDPFTARMRSLTPADGEAMAHIQRYMKYGGPATAKLQQLLAN